MVWAVKHEGVEACLMPRFFVGFLVSKKHMIPLEIMFFLLRRLLGATWPLILWACSSSDLAPDAVYHAPKTTTPRRNHIIWNKECKYAIKNQISRRNGTETDGSNRRFVIILLMPRGLCNACNLWMLKIAPSSSWLCAVDTWGIPAASTFLM